jgi:hypothetical protein
LTPAAAIIGALCRKSQFIIASNFTADFSNIHCTLSRQSGNVAIDGTLPAAAEDKINCTAAGSCSHLTADDLVTCCVLSVQLSGDVYNQMQPHAQQLYWGSDDRCRTCHVHNRRWTPVTVQQHMCLMAAAAQLADNCCSWYLFKIALQWLHICVFHCGVFDKCCWRAHVFQERILASCSAGHSASSLQWHRSQMHTASCSNLHLPGWQEVAPTQPSAIKCCQGSPAF